MLITLNFGTNSLIKIDLCFDDKTENPCVGSSILSLTIILSFIKAKLIHWLIFQKNISF